MNKLPNNRIKHQIRRVTKLPMYGWSSTGELKNLEEILMRGQPVSLGLMQFEFFRHEVVACAIETDIPMLVGEIRNLPRRICLAIHVYDPGYPACDTVIITLDRNSTATDEDGNPKKIYFSTGENWKGFFVSDDYEAKPPRV